MKYRKYKWPEEKDVERHGLLKEQAAFENLQIVYQGWRNASEGLAFKV